MSDGILQPGQRLCGTRGVDFRVVEWVGEGSYARVYRAEAAEGVVALKVAKPEVPGAEERLAREEELLALLAHPALPTLRDAGRTRTPKGGADTRWLARRWVEGVTLRRRLDRDRSLPLVQAVSLLLRIAGAVAALHAIGWTHGDLRPENVLIEAESHRAFLLDLGEARHFEEACGPVSSDADAGPPASPPASSRSAPHTERRTARSLLPRRPQPAAPGSPLAPAAACDLRQLGELLAWALTGIDPAREPERLSPAGGYHPLAVHLWRDSRVGAITSAAAFHARLEALARQLRLKVEERVGR